MLQIKTYETLNREELENDVNYSLKALEDAVVSVQFSHADNGSFFAAIVYKDNPGDNFIK